MSAWLYGGQMQFEKRKELFALVGQHKELANFIEFEDMTQDEQQENLWRRVKFIYENHGQRFFKNFDLWDYPYFSWPGYFQGLLPGIGLQVTMFMLSVENLSNEE
jgi:hypothetical protein